ncbi:MAG: sulfite exporter TauE/SafE family protein [Gammaproteobacteria bacterium]|nr:sulfite exporter TauE/SafE family protein [Gammaproteobacteria bacterium]NNJ84995.1 sulfite exporter TauE/SafE family protein [Gammaproteobacteria bacterium]
MIEPQQLPLIWGVIIVAATLRAFTGFGFALASVPAFALFLTPAQSVVLSVSLTLGLSIQTWPQYRTKVLLKPLLPMFAFAAVGTALGALLLVRLSAEIFQLAIGVATILACLVLSRYHPRHRTVHPALTWGTGLAGGVLNGALAIPGPPIIVYAMATEPNPEKSRAFMLMFFAFSSATALAGYGIAGLVDLQSLYLFLLSYPAIYLGDKIGYRLFLHYSGKLYRGVALATLFLIGIAVIVKGSHL